VASTLYGQTPTSVSMPLSRQDGPSRQPSDYHPAAVNYPTSVPSRNVQIRRGYTHSSTSTKHTSSPNVHIRLQDYSQRSTTADKPTSDVQIKGGYTHSSAIIDTPSRYTHSPASIDTPSQSELPLTMSMLNLDHSQSLKLCDLRVT
jgi:hypothetical protein